MTGVPVEAAKHALLICSVGGTPEPVVKSLLHWKPARILFVPSEQTRPQVDAVLSAFAEAADRPLSPGQYDVRPVPDAEDLLGSVRAIRAFDRDVAGWLARDGEDYCVIVDFTAGTKSMTAALALVARRWRCRYSYVGGHRRTKGGAGVVESGAERVVHSANPWDALGYQAVEDTVTVFNHGGYAAAAHLLDGAMKNSEQPGVKRELSTLKAVIDAYAAWDRFDHKEAAKRFDDALKNRNDLLATFPHDGSSLVARLERHRDRVANLAREHEPTAAWVEDLVHNARRRAAERRFDDAVARLYRAFEALAQVRLREQHSIPDTKAVPLDRLPEPLHTRWAARAQSRAETLSERSSPAVPAGGSSEKTRESGLMLGLRDAYELLEALGDELGRKFFELGLAAEPGSPLVARNHSILAHGFQPVSEKAYDQLDETLRKLFSPDHAESPHWRLPVPR